MRLPKLCLFTLTCSFGFAIPNTNAAEYSRYAIDSVTIPDGGANTRDLFVGGQNYFNDNDGDPVAGSYSLAPFSFSARDFSLAEVESINSANLTLTNELSVLTDTGNFEVFYVPDSRADLGVELLEESATCLWRDPQLCYNLFYNADQPNGIDPAEFSAAPQSLGSFEMDWAEAERFKTTVELNLNDEVKSSLIGKLNSGEGFHLLFGAVVDDGFLSIGAFDSGADGGPGADIRPRLDIDASGVAGGVTKDLIRQGAIHSAGDTTAADFYGSGNDDNFSEFGIAGWQFTREDFGVSQEITDLLSVELTLNHNERSFTDGDMVEFFLTVDAAADLAYDELLGYTTLTYDEALENGIAAEQFTNAPISLGTYEYQGKFGGVRDTFNLNLPEEAEQQLLAAINEGDDFHIIIASPDPTFDITYSGLDSAFEPGNPQLTISVESGPVDPTCVVPSDGIAGDLDGDGTVAFADFLVLSTNFNQAVGTYQEGDIDCDGTVAFADFLVLSNNFNKSAGQTASVPEPLGLALLSFCLGGFTAFTRWVRVNAV